MSNLLEYGGTGLNAAGDLLGGVGGYLGGMAQASSDAGAAARVVNATNIRLTQQQRQGFLIQGKAQANIGANGLTVSGSAADILRSNASNLALDHGIIQAQGSEQASQYTTAASAAKAGAWGDIIKGVVGAVGVVAAPFTGGASLALTAAAAG